MNIHESIPSNYPKQCPDCPAAKKAIEQGKSNILQDALWVEIKVTCDPNIPLSAVTEGVTDSPFAMPMYWIRRVDNPFNPSCPRFYLPKVEAVICPGKQI